MQSIFLTGVAALLSATLSYYTVFALNKFRSKPSTKETRFLILSAIFLVSILMFLKSLQYI